MTDLELPNLEFGRYVDLVKRRRWQLVPIGLLGLFIGFIVAWSIPRYYEAGTKVQLRPRLIGGQVSGWDREDPFLREVNKARMTIQNYQLVRDAIEKLGWDDYFAVRDDFEKASAFIWDVVSRVNVLDLDPSRNRSSATLEISFRDQDPRRAADFTNVLREAYFENEREALVQSAEIQLGLLQTEAKRAREVLDRQSKEMQLFQESTGYIPTDTEDQGGRRELRSRQQELRELERGKQELVKQIADLKTTLDLKRQRLSVMDKRRPVQVAGSDVLLIQRAQLVKRIESNKRTLEKWQPGFHGYQTKLAEIEADEERLAKIEKEISEKGLDTEPNPEFQALQREIALGGEEIAGLNKRLEMQEALVAAAKKENAGLPDILRRYRAIERELDSASTALDKAEEATNAQRREVALLKSGDDVIIQTLAPATPPLAPNYPNRLLLTLIGLGIGLAFAIVAILALDFLQPTWKSMDEVARGLGGLAVLGGVAHLDLPEEIEAARKRRGRMMLAIGLVLLLIAALLTIYFVDPLRLPEWMQVLLDSFLGGKG
ncbi:MAG: hypothetical protein CSA62_13515 [Planctomycetota bacterium]|nr:MAG: hypothetical protein CSA62_13515 [Planctomycetota bacterium]